MSTFKNGIGGLMVVLGMVVMACSVLGAYLTHIFWAISTLASDQGATAGQMVLALIGCFVPPVGAIHGFIIWFT